MNLDQNKSKSSFWKLFLILLLISSIAFASFYHHSQKKKIKKAKYLYSEAIKKWQEAKKDKAEKLIASAIQNHDIAKYNYTAYRFLALQRKIGLAEIYLTKAADIDRTDDLYQYKTAMYVLSHDYEKAHKYIKRALKIKPNNPLYLREAASIEFRLGETKKTIELLNKCLKKDPASTTCWNNLAYYKSLQDKKIAIDVLENGLDLNPNSAYLWYQKAIYERDLGLKSDAIESLEKSIDAKPISGKNAAKLIYEISGKQYQGKHSSLIKSSMMKVPYKYEHKHYYLYAYVKGIPGWFLLDTGASTSILYESFLRKKKLKPGVYHDYRLFETVQGMFSMPLTRFDLKLGEIKLNDIEFGIRETDRFDRYDGIIGQNILGQYSLEINKELGFIKLISD